MLRDRNPDSLNVAEVLVNMNVNDIYHKNTTAAFSHGNGLQMDHDSDITIFI